ncbi:MAG: dockerin type I repeat-containing protein [Candidatus Zixiibacteriota bacterium]|nr:MAG: dockerin type I repeat-containing protein [candidate division Zixibacteria bacterium]
MKKLVLALAVGVLFVGLTGAAWAQDNGIRDSLYITCPDSFQYTDPPWDVRVSLLVTNDIPNPVIDSIAGMVILLCYRPTNPSANAHAEPAKNTTLVHPYPDLNASIFRHLPSMEDPQIRNWMMDYSEPGLGLEWDTRILDLTSGDNNLWLSLVPTGYQDQRFCGGRRVLTATMTVTLEDTTTLRIDTCFWPMGRTCFSRSDAVTYMPWHNGPLYVNVRRSVHGDANGDGTINIADVMYMVNYLYRNGPYPASFEAGDANCDGVHGILDVLILVNYLYKGGRPPGCI